MPEKNIEIYPKLVVIIDADEYFSDNLKNYLSSLSITCKHYMSSEIFLEDIEWRNHNIFIIDPDLPGMDGMDLISLARHESDSGILVTTSRSGPDAFVCAMSAGADMVLYKPLRFDQIVYALKAIFGRIRDGLPQNHPIRSWSFSKNARLLKSPDGRSVRLTHSEALIVCCLKEAKGCAVPRPALIEAAGISVEGYDRNLDALMFRLRKKIANINSIDLFKTVHGLGYKLKYPLIEYDSE